MRPEQKIEVDKYIKVYRDLPSYHMRGIRGELARRDLASIDNRGSYLDVGCGRGEMLFHARDVLGFKRIAGTETVPQLYAADDVIFSLANDLPFHDSEFDVVSCLDVLEHLLPEDTESSIKELDRVAGKALLLTANNRPSNSTGVELHINRRPYNEWDKLIKANTTGHVTWVKESDSASETWVIVYD